MLYLVEFECHLLIHVIELFVILVYWLQLRLNSDTPPLIRRLYHNQKELWILKLEEKKKQYQLQQQ